MAFKNPLCLYGGRIEELRAGDNSLRSYTQAALDAAAAASQLIAGEAYWVSNRDALALGLSATAYQLFNASGTVVGPASAMTDTTGVLTNIPGMLLPAQANATYAVNALIVYQTTATSVGMAMALGVPSGATVSGGMTTHTSANAVQGTYQIADGATKGSSTVVLVANENVPARYYGIVKTAAQSGDIQLMFRSEATNACTAQANLCYLKMERIA
jgi:hypothetical protein